jgi:hypothetical protein
MRRLILGVAVGAGLLFAHVPPAQADDGDGWWSDGGFEAGGSLTDDGAEAHASRTSTEESGRQRRSGGTVRCSYFDDATGEPFDPGSVDPEADWGSGIILVRICEDTRTGEQVSFEDGMAWLPRQGPLQMDPRTLAELQVSRLAVPAADVGTNPSPDREQMIRVPTWLWIESAWEPVSATATAGPVSATVTATPNRVVWDMGDGNRVTCNGPGTPYDSSRPAGEQHTDCSHTYERTSVGQPGERFRVTATVYWSVAFSSNVGASGALGEVTETREFSLRVTQAQALNQQGARG